jgi:hypothetical protein
MAGMSWKRRLPHQPIFLSTPSREKTMSERDHFRDIEPGSAVSARMIRFAPASVPAHAKKLALGTLVPTFVCPC